MEIIRLNTSGINHGAPPAVLCLGNFDGVHIGHAALLKKTIDIKNSIAPRQKDIICGVFTFSRPPLELLDDAPPPRVISFEEKMELFSMSGIERAYVADFLSIRHMTPDRFADEVLIKKCNCVHAVCGYNFRFGENGAGDADTLSRELGGRVSVVGPVTYRSLAVSSTAIRRAVLEGDMETAAGMLGRPFSLSAPVIHGHAVGGKLGFATANQDFPTGNLIPAPGVYISSCRVGGKEMPAVSDIGRRPTFGDLDVLRCETHIIGYSGDLYGQTIRVEFHKYLRPDIKFQSTDELVAAVKTDIGAAIKYFGGN